MGAVRTGESALLEVIAARGWRLDRLAKSAPTLPPTELDMALRLAADLAGESCEENMKGWREALFTEARRRLFPEIYAEPTPELEQVAAYFFPLAEAVLREMEKEDAGVDPSPSPWGRGRNPHPNPLPEGEGTDGGGRAGKGEARALTLPSPWGRGERQEPSPCPLPQAGEGTSGRGLAGEGRGASAAGDAVLVSMVMAQG